MKADAKFLRYSERQWRAIEDEVARLPSRIDKVELVELRDKLEQLGRECVSAPVVDRKRLKFLDTKERQAAQFRRQVVEAGQLPPELKGRVAEVVDEIARLYRDRAVELHREAEAEDWGYRTKTVETGPHYLRISYTSPPRPQNAQLPHIDRYFDLLVTVWMGLGDDWWSDHSNIKNIKPLRAFIAACARPVIGPKSTTERAIAARLRQLDARMGRVEHKRARS
jgi:hypothetical protein